MTFAANYYSAVQNFVDDTTLLLKLNLLLSNFKEEDLKCSNNGHNNR